MDIQPWAYNLKRAAHSSNPFRNSHEVNGLISFLPLWCTYLFRVTIGKKKFLYGRLTWNYMPWNYNALLNSNFTVSYHSTSDKYLTESRMTWALFLLKRFLNVNAMLRNSVGNLRDSVSQLVSGTYAIYQINWRWIQKVSNPE